MNTDSPTTPDFIPGARNWFSSGFRWSQIWTVLSVSVGTALWSAEIACAENNTTDTGAVSVYQSVSVLGSDNSDESIAEEFSRQIEDARSAWQVPGMSVAVVKDGKILLSGGFGVRETGSPDEVDGDTLFAIASNTKAFTAAALAILDEEGKAKWNDRAQQHLPWLQLYDVYVSAELRIDDLLCHRSGLGTFSGDLLWWGTPYSPEDVLRRMRHLEPGGAFRSSYGYSNLMYLAAGEVIAAAGGMPWSEFVDQRLLRPAGMHRTIASITRLNEMGNYATPHKSLVDGVRAIPWYNWDTMAAAGGLISSSNDMAKWLRIQLDRGRIDEQSRLFSEASSHRMWSPHTIIPISETARRRMPSTHFRSYGLGWNLADYKGRMIVSHGGGYDGMYSHVMLVPEEHLGIVVLTNSMTGLPSAVSNTIADRFLGGDAGDFLTSGLERDRSGRESFNRRIADAVAVRVEDTHPRRNLNTYTGTFRCPLYGDATVAAENGALVFRLLPNPDLVADLTHLQFDTWKLTWRKEFAWFAEGTIQFVPDEFGNFTDLRLNVPNDDLWFDELKLKKLSDR